MLKRFIVERQANGVGFLSMDEYSQMAKVSNQAIDKLGSGIQWQESYVTDNKLYCVYLAENEQLIWEHAKIGGFPIHAVSEVKKSIDPTTATLAESPYVPSDEQIYDSIL
jgi:hypothetical protein